MDVNIAMRHLRNALQTYGELENFSGCEDYLKIDHRGGKMLRNNIELNVKVK